MWLSMAILVPQIPTSTFSSPSHLVQRRQASRLLFLDAWFIVAMSMLILLQLPTWLTHPFMSSISTLLKLLFMLNVIVDICLVDLTNLLPCHKQERVGTCSFFLSMTIPIGLDKCNIHYLLVHYVFHVWLIINSSIWNYPLVDITYWSHSSF
jgi:hypothetical protein